jgi:hypothetical protein
MKLPIKTKSKPFVTSVPGVLPNFTSPHSHSGATLQASAEESMKQVVALIATFLISIPLSNAQSARPQFEVASVKANVDNGPPSFQAQPGGRFLVRGPFKLMVALAYTIRDYQISGGPGWITTDRWDVEGKAPEGSIPAGLEYPSPATRSEGHCDRNTQ